ncbi:MAG: hypothetical protein R3B48_13030 [Kofleriaceae bacterium]
MRAQARRPARARDARRGPRRRRSLTWLGVLASLAVSLAGCRRAAFALLPRAPMGPQRNDDPFAPLGPPVAARAPERQAPTVSTAAGKVDVGVSAAAALVSLVGGPLLLLGTYGAFEETAVIAPERAPARPSRAPPAAPAPPTAPPPAAPSAPAP